MKLFGRKAQLTVNEKVFDLDVSFEVERTSGNTTNKATIKVYNLSASSRGYVESKGKEATLAAGYADMTGVIFKGNINRAHHERVGADVITTLECADGSQAIRFAMTDISLEDGVTDRQVMEKAISELRKQGLGRGFVVDFAPQNYLGGGYCFSGPASKLMDEICAKRGLSWSVQTGLVQVLKKGEAAQGSAVLLSAETGLVGFPSKKDSIMTAKSLLNPNIYPGRKVRLRSLQTALNGDYVVNKAKYSGDLREAEFVVEIEGSLLAR